MELTALNNFMQSIRTTQAAESQKAYLAFIPDFLKPIKDTSGSENVPGSQTEAPARISFHRDFVMQLDQINRFSLQTLQASLNRLNRGGFKVGHSRRLKLDLSGNNH